MYSEMKVNILNVMDEDLLSNPLFCKKGSNMRFRAKLQEAKNDLSVVISTQGLVVLLVILVNFSNQSVALHANDDCSKMGKKALQVFSSNVCTPATQEVLKIFYYDPHSASDL